MVQPVRVLVVDDSRFFQRRIIELLESDARLKVIDTAANGEEALTKVLKQRPDVVTMDIEMPVMDGITAVRRIMRRSPLPILMFSSLTHEGAKATLDALDAGAMDFLPKSFEDIAKNPDELRRVLCRRVHSLGFRALPQARSAVAAVGSPPIPVEPRRGPDPVAGRAARPAALDIVAIGASTGGPVALQTVLTELPGHFRWPMLLIQHMPSTFTGAFAERLNQKCSIAIKEAADGDLLRPGLALLAPGGKQMVIESSRGVVRARVTDSDPDQHYRPSVDVTFSSVAEVYSGRSLGVVLTGMGADGREGARLMKQRGASVWAQDEASSVIYGMPAAIVEAGLADCVLPIAQIGSALAKGT